VQGKKISKPKYLEELPFRTVYVSPFDMNILYFSPAMRREYLDDILSRAYAQFSKIKRDYEQVMRQRNALLKKIREDSVAQDGLDFWDQKFAEIALQYGLYRERYIRYITEKIPEFPDFFAHYQIRVKYEGNWIYQENPENFIRNYLQENRQRDIFSGHTHIGPHRDDFSILMKIDQNEEHSVQFFLSRGEMKMILLGLKVIEADFIAKQTEKQLILLVDDIFAELDENNIILFLNIIIQHQIILTSQKSLPDGINHEKFTCINLVNS
jgi:DNA replication and repair protein recF